MSLVGGLCFCQDCGNLLDRPVTVKQKTIECDACNASNPNQWPISRTSVSRPDAFPSSLARKKSNIQEFEVEKSGITVERKCTRCGNDKMLYSELQTRSADEGSTLFYRCPACDYREMENN